MELVDDPDYLQKELKKVHVDGYHLHVSKTKKNGITGTYVDVHLEADHHHHHDHDHDHEHEHHHHDHEHHHDHHHHDHRNLFDVNKIIDEADIDLKAKELAKKIFLKVALAESKVHNETLENVHFHEVGAIDSIVDIIGTAILITKIAPDKIMSSVVNDGHGFIQCAHGMISVPVPATSEIFAASDVMFRQIDIDTELVTPTGAAIIAQLAQSFGTMPAMKVNKIGWGCGTKDLKIPNVLKVLCGTIEENQDEILVIETNIDDCSGEILGFTMEQLFAQGALDVFFTPIFMKKNRPAYRLSIACHPQQLKAMQDVIFKHTTSIGLRYRREQRTILNRQNTAVMTPFGEVRGKVIDFDGSRYVYPEYEDVKAIAQKQGLSIRDVFDICRQALNA